MPITIPVPGITIPSGANALVDLATYDFVANLLAAGGFTLNSAQQLVVPALITAASKEMSRWCGRLFPLNSYAEIVTPEDGGRGDRGEPAMAKLSLFPVVDVTRVSTGRTGALLVSNTDTTTNQDAWIKFVVTGDVEWPGLLYTGLTLTRFASGTQDVGTVSWTTASPYTTISSVAAAINALGGGWSATVQSSGSGSQQIGLLPAAWLVGAREPKGAFSPGTTLEIFKTTGGVSYDVDRRTGLLRCYYGSGLGFGVGGGAYGDTFGPSWDGAGGWGGGAFCWPQVRVEYTAGMAVIPEPLQRVCAEVVKAALERVSTDSAVKTEDAGDYSYAVRDAWQSLPDWCRETMGLYKDWSC